MTDARWQLVAYVFASIVLWMVVAQLARRRTGVRWVHRLSQGWVASILRFVYYVGLPYAALILGAVPARYLGLVGLDRLQAAPAPSDAWQFFFQARDAICLIMLDWLPDMDTMVGLAVVVLILSGMIWLGYSHFRRSVAFVTGTDGLVSRKWVGPSIVWIVYQAIHWSFYRSVVWLLTDNLYLGVIGGILLVGGEWLLDPGWAARIRYAPSAEEPLIDASLLFATSVMFFFVPNLWLLVPIHWLLAIVSRRMVAWGQWRMAGGQ